MKVFVVLFEYDKFDSVWSTKEKAEERIKEINEMDSDIECEVFDSFLDDCVFDDIVRGD